MGLVLDIFDIAQLLIESATATVSQPAESSTAPDLEDVLVIQEEQGWADAPENGLLLDLREQQERVAKNRRIFQPRHRPVVVPRVKIRCSKNKNLCLGKRL